MAALALLAALAAVRSPLNAGPLYGFPCAGSMPEARSWLAVIISRVAVGCRGRAVGSLGERERIGARVR